MILPKHPDQMEDDDLRDWVLGLVDRNTPESIFLDYKQTVAVQSPSEKREIAKDVSSFANERGGVILYGVHQKDGPHGEPIPAQPIGMDPIEGLPETIENILIDTLTPRLPELRVRQSVLDDPPSKIICLVWHPESWEAPHMIHAYGEHRYYKRGNFRAVPMEEGEVERLYVRRRSRRALATEFLQATDFGESLLAPEQLPMRVVVCPAFPFENRWDFSHVAVRQWLQQNVPSRELSEWRPFFAGVRCFEVRSLFHPEAEANQRREDRYVNEWRLFGNGAVSRCAVLLLPPSVPTYRRELPGPLLLGRLDGTLAFVGRLYEHLGMTGDVFIDVQVLHMAGVPFDHNQQIWPRDKLEFRTTASAAELLSCKGRWRLEEQMMERLTQCFGLWLRPSVYFREDGSPLYHDF